MALTRRTFVAGCFASTVLVSRASAGTLAVEGLAFGSRWRLVTADAPSGTCLECIDRIITRVDAQMSPYRASTALSWFNAHRGSNWQTMPTELCTVADEALGLARFTGGAFDPTVGPTVHRFGFGPVSGEPGRFEDISVRLDALRKRDPGLTLDLCGIAKGYALDRITSALRHEGLSDFMLELGGEVRASGRHPSGRSWRIAIEDPFATGMSARFIVEPGEMALATSGHRANGVMGQVATSHIIDPQSMRPVAPFAGSVSVLAQTAMRADALATALTAMGSSGPGFAERHGIAALFLLSATANESHITTGGFRAHILL